MEKFRFIVTSIIFLCAADLGTQPILSLKLNNDRMNNAIFYHEDYYRQIELVSNRYYSKTYNEISNLPEQNGSKYGFDNITIRSEESHLEVEKISIDELRTCIDSLSISFYEKVESGTYSGKPYRMDNTVVWGFEGYGIFVEYSEKKIVTSIWIVNSPIFPKDYIGQHLFEALITLGKTFSFILVDWDSKEIIDLKDILVLKEYLSEKYYLNPVLKNI